MKKLIGIEREYFLVDMDNNIIEPDMYGFPIDEFGFLIEIRTQPHDNPDDLINEFVKLYESYEAHAQLVDLKLSCSPRLLMPRELKKYLSKKYHWESLPDLTANIYSGTNDSHATGIRNGWATAGTHVHFSKYNDGGFRVQLPIRDMVSKLDSEFIYNIQRAHRIPGEFEIKPWGFEYRSLPNNVGLEKIIRYAFKLLAEMD